MKRIIVSCFALFLCAGTVNVQAQNILGKLGEKAAEQGKKALEKKLNQKLEKTAEDTKKSTLQALGNMMGGNKNSANNSNSNDNSRSVLSNLVNIGSGNSEESGTYTGNATTAFELVSECPALPSSKDLAKQNEVVEQYRNTISGIAEHYSKLQEESLEKMAAGFLGAMFGMSGDDILSMKDKEEDEVMDIMKQNNAKFMGLTPDEIKAMENMTEEEQATYIQSGDRMARIQQAQMEGIMKLSEAVVEDSNKINLYNQMLEEYNQLVEKWFEERNGICDKFNEIGQRYAARFPKKTDDYYTDAQMEQINSLTEQALKDCFDIWREKISDEQKKVMNLIGQVKDFDYVPKTTDISHVANAGRSLPFIFAGHYISLATSGSTIPCVPKCLMVN